MIRPPIEARAAQREDFPPHEADPGACDFNRFGAGGGATGLNRPFPRSRNHDPEPVARPLRGHPGEI